MAIIGIQRLLFGVKDVAECTRFFTDLGLDLRSGCAERSCFELPEGSSIILMSENAAELPCTSSKDTGVREVIWAVDTRDNMDRLAEGLARDLPIEVDREGVVHFDAGFGVPMGLCLSQKRRVQCAPDQLNAPGAVNRLNRPRKWQRRARPKVINHVVFAARDYVAAGAFMREKLGFRLTDVQVGVGIYLRADGTNNHHSFLLVNAAAPLPGFDGQTRFNHVNFGVEDLDEIMRGVNHMVRQGWAPSQIGLGRHRIDSGLFYYLPSPTGGEVEYGADADYVDDNWVPRRWPAPLFGYAHFTHNLPAFLQQEPEWRVEFISEADAEMVNGAQ